MRWRKKAVDMLGDLKGKTALDLCCGSGDFLTILSEFYHSDINLYGADFAKNMLNIAHSRLGLDHRRNIILCQADAQALPFADNSINAVTIGFGIRNVTDKNKSLKDIHRVLSPTGKLVIIEPSIPKNKFVAFCFGFYFGKIMPLIGGLISGDFQAYKYLNKSVEAFPLPDNFCQMMTRAGFSNSKAYPQLLGTAVIYYAEK